MDLYFLPMVGTLIVTLLFSILFFRSTKDYKKSLFFTSLLNLSLLGASGYWWFFYEAADGFSQMFGIMYYGVALFVNGAVYTLILTLMKKTIR